MRSYEWKTAVVTGAGSGIGRALAVELGRRGAKLAISDIDHGGLVDTERTLRNAGVAVKADLLDVTKRDAVHDYAESVRGHFGTVHQIYNNAGIAFAGDVEVTTHAEFEVVMDVDFWGVVNGTKAFLPHVIASGDGHVINVSSVFGLFAVPGQAAYNAAKFAVRGFTEALRQEMVAAKRPVGVTCVHPGGVKTDVARHMSAADGFDTAKLADAFDRVALTSAPSAARIILRGVAKNRPRVLVGPDAKAMDLVVRITGSRYQPVIAALSALAPGVHQPAHNTSR